MKIWTGSRGSDLILTLVMMLPMNHLDRKEGDYEEKRETNSTGMEGAWGGEGLSRGQGLGG